MATRDRGLERAWRRRVREQRASGLSVRAYCRRDDLAESAFYFWRRELAHRDAEGRVAPAATQWAATSRRPPSPVRERPRFVPVIVTANGSATAAAAPTETASESSPAVPSIELVHPGGIVVRVPAGGDASALRMILDVLDARAAENRRC